MKKQFVVLGLLLCLACYNIAFADSGRELKGPSPENIPATNECGKCHGAEYIYDEMISGSHQDLQCYDCHIPGGVQQGEYNSEENSFSRLGFHKAGEIWLETIGNDVCLRCHVEKGINNTKEKCWTCHMPSDGRFDRIIPITMPEDGSLDKWIPPEAKGAKQASAENTHERIKYYKHLSHKFKIHMKVDKK